MRLVVKLATTFLLAIPSAASAQTQWVRFQTDTGLQYDATRVRKAGSQVTLWVKAEFLPPRHNQSAGRDYDKLVASYIVDCDSKRYKTLASVQYDKGEVITDYTPALDDNMIQILPWRDPVPESLGEEIVTDVCRTW